MFKSKYANIIPTKEQWQRFIENEPRYLLMDIIGSFFYAAGVMIFVFNADFAPGGVTGVSLIFNHFFPGLTIGVLSILINIPIIFLALRFLGGLYLIRTFQTILINAFFLDIVLPFFPKYPITGPVDNLFAAVFGGVIFGLGLGIIYQTGTCTGGSDLVIMSIRKVKPHFSVGEITILIDGIIILAGVFVYKSLNALMYGILFTASYTVVIDRFMSGATAGKMALIISDHSKEIWEDIRENLERGGTFLKAEGAYSGADKKILLVACNKKQVPAIRKIVGSFDPKALTIILDYSEARGEGFIPHYEDFNV